MSDGDFGGDGGGGDDGASDGGAFDLNNNGTSLDEFVLLAVLTENGRAKRSSGGGPAKKADLQRRWVAAGNQRTFRE
jgi:hypothetical protein